MALCWRGQYWPSRSFATSSVQKILEPLEILGGIANIVFFVVIILTLAILSPRSPASFVFQTTIAGLSGWENSGIQWCLGLLPAAFALSSKFGKAFLRLG